MLLLAAAAGGFMACAERIPQTWQIVEEARFGARESEFIRGVWGDADGRLHVVYAGLPGIHMFDPSGSSIRSIGLAGPGLVEDAIGMDWDDDGNLWVIDRATDRFVVFDSAGTFLRSHPRTSNSNEDRWKGGFAGGDLYDTAYGPGGALRPVLLRLRSDASIADTLPLPHYETPVFWDRPLMPRAAPVNPPGRPRVALGVRSGHPVPHAPEIVWRLDRRGFLWFGRSDFYRIVQRSLDGDTVRVVERDTVGETITAAQRESLAAEVRPYLVRGGVPDPTLIPLTKPIYDDLFADEAGRLWVRLRERSPPEFDVFDGEGYLARAVVIPSAPAQGADWWIPPEPSPVFRSEALYFVAEEGGDMERWSFVVRARIARQRKDD